MLLTPRRRTDGFVILINWTDTSAWKGYPMGVDYCRTRWRHLLWKCENFLGWLLVSMREMFFPPEKEKFILKFYSFFGIFCLWSFWLTGVCKREGGNTKWVKEIRMIGLLQTENENFFFWEIKSHSAKA